MNYTSDPREACSGANVIVTDTWVSMGQEIEAKQRLKDFKGYQVNNEVTKVIPDLLGKVFNLWSLDCSPAQRQFLQSLQKFM